jgi:hypothetical protein
MKHSSSETTTLPEAIHSRTGTQPGEIGSGTRASSTEVAAWLGMQTPAYVDRAAVSRASRHGVELQVNHDFRAVYDENGSRTGYATPVRGCDVTATPEAAAVALADLERLVLPSSQRTIEEWVAELSVITARRADDEFGEALRLNAYATRLQDYPADVARAALLDRTWKFFPTWAELKAVCEELQAPRRAMLSALRRCASGYAEPAEEAPRNRPSARRVQEIIREVWGDDK